MAIWGWVGSFETISFLFNFEVRIVNNLIKIVNVI